MVYSAEVEAEYFKNVGNVCGVAVTALFFFFPVIRRQPFTRRVLLAAIPGYYCYNWGHKTYEELKWLKTFAAYQRFVQYHGQHPKLFI